METERLIELCIAKLKVDVRMLQKALQAYRLEQGDRGHGVRSSRPVAEDLLWSKGHMLSSLRRERLRTH